MKDPEKQDSSDLDFEIHFYEGILKDRPNFIEALMAIGDLYTRKGLFQKGLEVDLKLAALRPDNAVIFYNLACSQALLKNIPAALNAIKKAIEFGYDDLEFLENDPDLSNLRQDQQFVEYLNDIKKRRKPSKIQS